MFRPLTILILATLCHGGRVLAAAPPPPSDLVRAELLPYVTAVRPGHPFIVGVLFNIKPEWHIYWKNPGDSGMPTQVKWNLPRGFSASDLRFPIPNRFDQGGVITYGYTNEVLLTATITPPNSLVDGESVDLSAQAAWLVCSDICLSGKSQLKLTLPVARKNDAANAEVFERWSKRMPFPAEKLSGVGVRAKPLDISTGTGSTEIEATGKFDAPPIPEAVPGLELSFAEPQPSPQGSSWTRIPVQARVLQGQQVAAKNVHVLVGPYEVTIPIVGAAGPATAPTAK